MLQVLWEKKFKSFFIFPHPHLWTLQPRAWPEEPGVRAAPQPQPRTQGPQHPPRHAQGTHQGLSNNLVERERETGRQQGQKVLYNLYPPLTKWGNSSKNP